MYYSELKERFENMSNGELATVISTCKSQYTSEALEIAMKVFNERGLRVEDVNVIISDENEEKRQEDYKYKLFEKLEKAETRIDVAVFLCILTGIETLVLSAINLFGINIKSTSVWGIADAAIVLFLSYGIKKKSRICAFLLSVYAVGSFTINPHISSMPGLRIIIYILGFLGTLSYHRYKDEYKRITS